jgi:hypothetical protein
MSLTIEKLCEIINTEFGSPFLVKDGVSAEILINDDGTKELSINIGRRDVQIDENGEVLGSGTFMGMEGDTLVFSESDGIFEDTE